MFPHRITAFLICVAAVAQTQVDLRTQTKNIDFSSALSTKPAKTGSALPPTCGVGEIFFLNTAPSGLNLYACVSPNTWALESGSGSGSVTVLSDGVPVGTRPQENFLTGTGITNTVVDTGTQINVTHSINTAVVQTKAAGQTGSILLCASASASSTAYTCSLTPTLIAYTTGMVLNWKPDVSGAGGSTSLNVDSVGLAGLKEADGVTDPSATDIVAGGLYQIWYDGALFRMLGVPATQPVAFGTNLGAWEPWPIASFASTQAVPQNGAIQFFEFTAPMSMSVGRLGMTPNGSASKSFSLAVYDSTCTLVASSATQAFTTGTAVAISLPVTLIEGATYYLGLSSNSTSSSDLITTAATGGLLSTLYNLGASPRFFTGSNTATWVGNAVTWPSNCGTKSALAGDPPAALLFK